jgi:hypothetical protein
MWRLSSTQHKGAAKRYDDKIAGGLKRLPISKLFIQKTSPVKTKYMKLIIDNYRISELRLT